MIPRRLGYPLLVALALAGLLSLPLFLSTYWVLIFTEILTMGLFAMSFNLLFGNTGLLSFGQAGFFGAGAYFAVLCLLHLSPSLWLALLCACIGAAVLSLVIGWLSVRLDEIYFAILTLGFGMMLFTVAHNWRSVTGGSDGLGNFALPALNLIFWKVSIGHPRHFYYLVLAVAVLGMLLLQRITRSPFGLMLRASRENSNRVAFVGANLRALRLMAFVLAGTLAGLAGALFALFNRIASPEMLHWSFSGKAVLMTILGGSGVFLGPVIGAALFFILEHWITSFTNSWMIFLGAILVFLVLIFPKGVLGTLMAWVDQFGKERHP